MPLTLQSGAVGQKIKIVPLCLRFLCGTIALSAYSARFFEFLRAFCAPRPKKSFRFCGLPQKQKRPARGALLIVYHTRSVRTAQVR
jgi:hypothetical protein